MSDESMVTVYEPRGVRLFDSASQREMVLVDTSEPRAELHGWLVYKHPDGQWVTLRRATDEESEAIYQEMSRAFHEDDFHHGADCEHKEVGEA